MNSVISPVRLGYEQYGVDGYYRLHSDDYENPHFLDIKYLLESYICDLDLNDSHISVLDLCCGSGEVTKILQNSHLDKLDMKIEGVDPYTKNSYIKNTGLVCLDLDFKDIVNGKLSNKYYDIIICSFAMHLCELSMLNTLLYQLHLICDKLIILTPHKRPEINNWFLLEKEDKYNKVRLRVYISNRLLKCM